MDNWIDRWIDRMSTAMRSWIDRTLLSLGITSRSHGPPFRMPNTPVSGDDVGGKPPGND
jgi:hypothetical protein